jgi:hypothetical protein
MLILPLLIRWATAPQDSLAYGRNWGAVILVEGFIWAHRCVCLMIGHYSDPSLLAELLEITPKFLISITQYSYGREIGHYISYNFAEQGLHHSSRGESNAELPTSSLR